MQGPNTGFVSSLEQRLRSAEKEKEALASRLARVEAETTALASRLEAAKSAKLELVEGLSRSGRGRLDLASQLATADQAKRLLEDQLARSEKAQAALSRRGEEAQRQYQEIGSELERVTADRSLLARRLSAMRVRGAGLERQVVALEGQKQRLERLADDSTEVTASLETKIASLAAQVQGLATENSNLEDRIGELQRELERREDRLSDAEAARAGLRRGLTRAQGERDDLQDRLSATAAERDRSHSRRLEDRERLASLQRSKMWLLWTAYHRLRGGAIMPFAKARRLFGASRRSLTSSLRRVGRSVGRLAGWIYLLFWTVRAQVGAGCRRLFRRRPAIVSSARTSADSPRPRVLMVCPYPIYPPDHGGGVRLFNLIQRVAAECDLHLLIFVQAEDDEIQRQALEPLVRKLHFHHWKPALGADRWGLQPPSAQLFDAPEVHRRLCEILSEERIDILQLEFTEMAQFGSRRYSRVKVAISEIDITFRSRARRRSAGFHRRYRADREFGHSFGDWMRQLRYELRAVRRADQVQVMSPADGDYLASYLGSARRNVRVIPNAVDTSSFRSPAGGSRDRRLLFVGNFQHLPNRDALDYLMAEIWPRVRELEADAELTVVGAKADKEVFRYDGQQGVTVVGAVPDPRDHYRGRRALLAPIRAGSGTRLKILEAMACGMPVLSTTLGAEGIDCVDGGNALIADGPDAFARAAVRLLDDDALCDRLGRAGRKLVEDRYDWNGSARALLAGWRELMARNGDRDPVRLEPLPAKSAGDVDISIIIPTLSGGAVLERCLTAISRQRCQRPFEVLCVDSGSPESDLASMKRHGARIEEIAKADFNHGLTRDLGARSARGRVMVFLNQDAVPCDERWLKNLTDPLFDPGRALAAVQGAILELPDLDERFYWDSCGERFYFTRESERWMEAYFGLGFSTVNAAIRRDVWQRYNFGEAQIMEDKKWQQQVVRAGHAITVAPEAAAFHTHNYPLGALVRRCQSEGFGWRSLGETYSFIDMARDMAQRRVWADWARGVGSRRIRTGAELLFPLLRPAMLYWGNRFARAVKH